MPVPVDGGTITVTGDGTYATPATTLDGFGVGCYTYTDSLPGTSAGVATATATGVPAETFLLGPAPAVGTTANQTSPLPRTLVSDSLTVVGSQGSAGTAAWSLVGPITPPTVGDCSSVSAGAWAAASATPLAQGTQAFTGDQSGLTVPTAGTRVAGVGCYSWAETVSGPNFLGATTLPAGSPSETFLAVPYQPSLATTATPSFGGTNTAVDHVTVSNSDLGAGGGAPASALLTWTLYGPVAPATPGSCLGITTGQWLAAPVAATNTLAVVNGTGNATPPVTLTQAGCYSYTNSLAAATNGDTLPVATTTPGAPSETFALVATQTMSTTANQATVAPRSTVSDAVTIGGTSGFSGTVAWSLVGPVAPPTPGDCTSVTGAQWSTAAATPYAQGTQAITGDQNGLTVPTGGTSVGGPGCYSWAETLTGANFLGPTTVAAGVGSELISVPTLQPSLVTAITTTVVGGVEQAFDTITVSGTDIAPGNTTGAPTSGTLTWTLLGPEPPVADTCVGVNWTGAPTAATGTIVVTGNSPPTYTTPTSVLTLGSCYSYTETLAATTDSAAYTAPAGVIAESAQIPPAPTMATTASSPLAYPHTTVTDAVTISGLGAYTGTLDWELVGPVTPVAGSCAGVNWTGAPVLGNGTTPVTIDGTLTTGPVTVDALGCYSWVDDLTGTFPGSATVAAGAANEVVLVRPYQPLLATTAALTTGSNGTTSIADTVAVTAAGVGTTGLDPSAALTWNLLGPVPPSAGSCAAVDWTGAPILDSGTLTVTGDGPLTTPASPLTAIGCYSYTASLPAGTDRLAATSAAGIPAETAILLDPPTVVTATSSALLHPHASVTDSVTLSGTDGLAGTVAWALVGPVAPAADGTCTGVSWAGAATAATGTTPVTADGTVATGPATVGTVGCYSWADQVSGANFLGATTVAAGAAGEVLLVQPFQPTLTTTATLAGASFRDTITVAGSGLGIAPGSPASAALTWTLLGPAPSINGGCAQVDWTSQPVLASGVLDVTGDGNYTTPPTTLTAPGCYTFFEHLASTTESTASSTRPGDPAETALLTAAVVAGPGTAAATLAFTGLDLFWLAGPGVVLLGAGLLLLASRRRTRSEG